MNNCHIGLITKFWIGKKRTTGCNGCESFLHFQNLIQALSYIIANFKPAQDVKNIFGNWSNWFSEWSKGCVISHNLRDTFQTRMQQRRERQFKRIGYYQYVVVLFFFKTSQHLKGYVVYEFYWDMGWRYRQMLHKVSFIVPEEQWTNQIINCGGTYYIHLPQWEKWCDH